VCSSCREPSALADVLRTKAEVRCAACSHELNLVRPALAFAEEPPAHALEESLRRNLPQADLLILIGPVPACGPVATVAASLAPDVPQIYAGEAPAPGPHEFDVRLIGPVDKAVRWLTEQLGWGTEAAASGHGASDPPRIVPPDTIYFGSPPPPGPGEAPTENGAAGDGLRTSEQPPAAVRVQTPLALQAGEDGRKRRSG
jgi:hypothetical protein